MLLTESRCKTLSLTWHKLTPWCVWFNEICSKQTIFGRASRQITTIKSHIMVWCLDGLSLCGKIILLFPLFNCRQQVMKFYYRSLGRSCSLFDYSFVPSASYLLGLSLPLACVLLFIRKCLRIELSFPKREPTFFVQCI